MTLAAMLSFSTTVSADIPPRPDYVENCTISTQQQEGETCVLCWATFDNNQMCTSLADMGFAHRCRARGGTSWNEVWCSIPDVDEGTGEGAEGEDPEPPVEPPTNTPTETTPTQTDDEPAPPTKPSALGSGSQGSFSRAGAVAALFCCTLVVGASVSLRRRRGQRR